ncbi:MAG: glycosyltransferase family 4 protein, partial [Flavisolibacter sp.]
QGTMYYPWHRNIKVVLTVHDLNFLYDESKSDAKKKKYLKQLADKVKRADYIVAISQFVLDDLKKNIPLAGKPAKVIYNGCTLDEIEYLTAPSFVPDAPFIFTIGTIVDKKNFHVLPRLLKNNQYQLLIAGITNSEEYKSRIIAEARALGVEDRVVFTGAVSENDKQWYLKNCIAFAFPSTAEGFGLPVIEAMYFGKPVLLSRFTSLPEIGGDDAYYFDSFEPDYMVKMFGESLEHFQKNDGRKKMKERALLFDWTRSARQYQAVYDELLQGK